MDIINVSESTPKLGELLPYDVVVTWSNYSYENQVTMGDVLADYVDEGHGVILGNFVWYGPTFSLAGRIQKPGYSPLEQLGESLYETACLGDHQDHPIMADVTTACDFYRDNTTVEAGATLVASWDDGHPFVAVNAASNVVGITSYPGNNREFTGDVALIYYNAINFIVSNNLKTCLGSPCGSSKPCGDKSTAICGTNGDDVICGTDKDDIILAKGGNDLICAGDGNDIIDAGDGNDKVDAGPGDDVIKGGSGKDVLIGNAGDDIILGSTQDDVLEGGPGKDHLYGGNGNDVLFGRDGDDVLCGLPGTRDHLNGGEPNGVSETDECDNSWQVINCKNLPIDCPIINALEINPASLTPALTNSLNVMNGLGISLDVNQ